MTYRKVTFTRPEENISKEGYFHLLKKDISLNGSEIVSGIIEDIETGKLHEVQISDFIFQSSDLEDDIIKSEVKRVKQPVKKTGKAKSNTKRQTIEKELAPLPYDIDNDFTPVKHYDEDGNEIIHAV